MEPQPPSPPPAGTSRGALSNPTNRFESISIEPDPDWYDPDERPTATRFYRDATRTIINYNDSPDIGFDASINPYRGCEHGCIYCYARPFHEYLGFSSGLDFETRILVKEKAPELLREELASPKWHPQVIALSGVTDCYQPVERKLQITRRCLQILAEFRNPVAIVTKNQLVTRDIDHLTQLAHHRAALVYISIPTLQPDLRKVMEPRTSPPAARLAAIRALATAGIPVGILTAPVIPGLTDHEIPAILQAAAGAGARFASYTVLRLPHAVAELFDQWLTRHFPARRDKVLNRVRDIRDGALNDPRFGARMRGSGRFADQISDLFHIASRRCGLEQPPPELSTTSFRRPGEQRSLL